MRGRIVSLTKHIIDHEILGVSGGGGGGSMNNDPLIIQPDGNASAGTSPSGSRADHVHPSDTGSGFESMFLLMGG